MATKKKIYAVKKGRETGVFTTWEATKAQVEGFAGAVFKGFGTRQEAEAYLNGTTAETPETDAGVIIGYSDGGSRNTGNVKDGHVRADDKAAWAYRLEIAGQVISDTGGEFGATNNRMEIMALIQALKKLKALGKQNEQIEMVLDSKYVLDAITKGWLKGWQRRGWQRSGGELKNAELWQKLAGLLPQFPQIEFIWTKGHANNAGNVYVDELLNDTMDHMNSSKPASRPQSTPSTPPVKKAAAAPEHVQPMTPEVQKSVDDIKHSLSQLDLFKDFDD